MKKVLLVCMAVLSLLSVYAQTLPATDGTYYFIKFKRGTNLVVKDMGAGNVMQAATLSLSDDGQLFKVEAGTTVGTFILTSKLGNKVNWNGSRFASNATTSVNIKFISTANTTYAPAWELQREGSTTMCMNPFGGSNSGSQLGEWNTGDGGNPAEFISYASSLKPALQAGITAAQSWVDNSVVGTDFGQFTAANKTTLTDAIAAAQTVYNNTSATETEVKSATTAINNAATAFAATANSDLHALLSSNANNFKWYRIKNKYYSTNDIITSNGVAEGGGITCQNAGTSNDNEMWRFELNQAGTSVRIINRATGLAIKENGTSVQSTLVSSSTATDFTFTPKNGYWAIGRVGASQFQYLHRDGGSKLVGWEAAAAASQWTLQFVEEAIKYNAADFSAAVAQARTFYNNTIGGTEYGQFPTTARTTFDNVIAANEAKTPANLTSQEILDGVNALQAATLTYTATLNIELEATPYKWYTMENAKYPGKYLTLDPTTKALTIADKDNSDNQLFRFSKKPSIDSYTNLYVVTCKSMQTGNIRVNSAWETVYDTNSNFPTDGTYNYVTMGYWPWNLTANLGTNGVQTLFQSCDWDYIDVKTNGTDVGNGGGGDAVYNGPAFWKISFAKQDLPTAVVNTTQSNITVCAKNGMIIVKGTNAPAKAFTTSGVVVDATKALKAGIYIVKVQGQSFKVSVQ